MSFGRTSIKGFKTFTRTFIILHFQKCQLNTTNHQFDIKVIALKSNVENLHDLTYRIGPDKRII